MVIEQILALLPASELARRISATPDPATGSTRKITPQAITKWVKKNRVPADRCLVVEKVLGGRITRYQMRPEIFGRQSDAA